MRYFFLILCILCSHAQTAPPKISEWAQEWELRRRSLSQEQVYALLDQGLQLVEKTELVNTLATGGSALFPHSSITDCGEQIAAVVLASLQACEKAQKKQILVLGVLHSLTETLRCARQREREGPIWTDPCRGIFGKGLPQESLLEKEFSVDNFMFLLEHAVKRSGQEMPKVIIRYPYLVYGQPETLLGIEDLQLLAENSIVIATADLCHHGTAYAPFGSNPETLGERLPISEAGYAFASAVIRENLRLLEGDDLLAYHHYCFDTIGDSFEVGQMLRFLLGPLQGHICDLKLVDASGFFPEKSGPNWVAVTLVELKARSFNPRAIDLPGSWRVSHQPSY